PVLMGATEVSTLSLRLSLAMLPVSLPVAAGVASGVALSLPLGKEKSASALCERRDACPALLRAEARFSVFSVFAASRCQVSVGRSSSRIWCQTLVLSIGANFGEKMRRTYR